MLARRQTALMALAGCFLAIYGMVVWLVATGTILRSPLVGTGATIDMTLAAAFATWWLGSRRGHLPKRAPLFVTAVGLLAARLILPDGARDAALVLRVAWG